MEVKQRTTNEGPCEQQLGHIASAVQWEPYNEGQAHRTLKPGPPFVLSRCLFSKYLVLLDAVIIRRGVNCGLGKL